jgi:hypothetical protein
MLRGVVLRETFRIAPALEKFAEFGMVHSKELREKRIFERLRFHVMSSWF